MGALRLALKKIIEAYGDEGKQEAEGKNPLEGRASRPGQQAQSQRTGTAERNRWRTASAEQRAREGMRMGGTGWPGTQARPPWR